MSDYLRQRLYMLELEELRRLKYAYYRKNPLAWLEEVFHEPIEAFRWSDYPEYADHKWDGDKNPLYEAWMQIAAGNWVSVAAATGTSKTYWLSRLVYWFLDCYEDSLVVASAPKETQLKLHLWSEISKSFHKFKEVRPYAKFTNLNLKTEGFNFDFPFKDSHQAIGFVAGVGADEQSSTKAQGFHRKDMLIICEEAAGMNGAIMTAFQNTCTGTNNILVAVGNPDSEMDELYKFSVLKNVKSYRISAYDYPNVVKGEDFINGAVTRASIQRRKDKYGTESPLYLSRVRGITPSEGDNNLMRKAWIEALDMHSDKYIGQQQAGYNGVGVDVSNSEAGDKAALAWGKGNMLDAIQEFQCPNASHLAHNLMMEDWELEDKKIGNYHTSKLKDYGIMADCVGVDSVGVGVSSINTFLEYGMRVSSLAGGAKEWDEIIPHDEQGKPLYHFDNLRSQMYWELREDIREGKVVFNITDRDMMRQIIRELTAAKFAIARGAVSIEGKEQIKKRLGGKSPNVADAIVYWNWVRKRYRNSNDELPVFGG